MWTVQTPLNAEVRARPARLAYLIPEHPTDELLDALIAECYARWGGRRTPFVPTDGNAIAPEYWALLDLWDPDIIYSYVPLTEKLEDRLYCCFAPSEVRKHTDSEQYRPRYSLNFSFVSSLSLLPLFFSATQGRGSDPPFIADRGGSASAGRDIDDSFGFVSLSYNSPTLLPYARRLRLQTADPKVQGAPIFKEPKDARYIEDVQTLLDTITKERSVLTVSRLSDMICPYLAVLTDELNAWDDHLTIVIGDTLADRLLFWNAQHRYPSLDGRDDIPVLRLSAERFEGGGPDWLCRWISTRNHRHLNGNNAPRTVLRSCSVSDEDLEDISHKLNVTRSAMVETQHHADPCLFEACVNAKSELRQPLSPTIRVSSWTHPRTDQPTRIRVPNNELELPLTLPWHVNIAAPSHLHRGVWAADVTTERAENHSPSDNWHHVWMFPRRLRMDQALKLSNYVIDRRGSIWPPPPRPTRSGHLTVWDSAEWPRPTLILPSDYEAIRAGITWPAPGSPEEQRLRGQGGRKPRFLCEVSDKGRDLLGVLRFFSSLPEAISFLTDPFWLAVIHRLSPEEPQDKTKSVSEIAALLQEATQPGPGQTPDYSRAARRALALAARTFASQREQMKSLNFDQLYGRAVCGRDQDQNRIKNSLKESVTYLRDRDFLWQGFKWVCAQCQHHNWVPLEHLSPINECQICRNPESAPVDKALELRLNPFVHHAFASTSAQEPVIWCLAQLAERAERSFAFAPSMNLYRPDCEQPATDLDLVAVVDGRTYFAEVKSSFAGIDVSKIPSQLTDLGTILRPNVIVLALYENTAPGPEIIALEAELTCALRQYDVDFELLTRTDAKTTKGGHDIARPLSRQMVWTGLCP